MNQRLRLTQLCVLSSNMGENVPVLRSMEEPAY